jgi:tetratricopeptide (TPR) repeat protein
MVAEKRKTAKTKDDGYSVYEKALKALHKGSYKTASRLFREIEKNFPKELELLDRVRTFQKVCERNLETSRPSSDAESVQELFDLGVYYHNNHEYEDALKCFEKARGLAGDGTDFILYAIAATRARLGEGDEAAATLEAAIKLRKENRHFARNDPDFEPVLKESKFRNLLETS